MVIQQSSLRLRQVICHLCVCDILCLQTNQMPHNQCIKSCDILCLHQMPHKQIVLTGIKLLVSCSHQKSGLSLHGRIHPPAIF